MEDLEFIKGFSKITISNACKKVRVDNSNLRTGRCSKEKIKEVRRYLESEIAKLYLLESEKNGSK